MKLIRKNIYTITFFVALIVVILFFTVRTSLKSNEKVVKKDEVLIANTNVEKEKKKEEIELEEFYVDIKGEVLNPGVYKVDNNTRVIDVINMAGGLLDSSDTSNINLSKKVKDEMVIIITNIEEKNNEKWINIKNDALIIKSDLVTSDNKTTSNSENINTNDISSESNISKEEIKVSLNSSTKEELMTLSGIGESKAEAIIKYRQEVGSFNNIEDVMNVSGIGESLYEKIKDNITT